MEDPRYCYWADKLGLLVWGEMPSAYHFNVEEIENIIFISDQRIRCFCQYLQLYLTILARHKELFAGLSTNVLGFILMKQTK